jgi:hypothetical protein
MKSLSRDQQLGLASPLNYAAIQSGKTKNLSKKEEQEAGAGCKPHRIPRGEGRVFFLDILFHRMSRVEKRRSDSSLPVAIGGAFATLPQSGLT